MKSIRFISLALFMLLALTTPLAAQNTVSLFQGNLTPVAPGPNGESAALGQINPAVFNLDASKVAIDLPDGKQVKMDLKKLETRAEGDVTWIGDEASDKNKLAVLTLKQGYVVGMVRRNDEAYEIRPAANGYHLIEKLNQASFGNCDGAVTPTSSSNGLGLDARMAAPPQRPQWDSATPQRLMALTATTSTVNIDVMVLYTPQARAAAGGSAQIQALIQSAVDNANIVFSNSQVDAQYTLVYTAEVTHNDAGNPSTDLDWLRTDTSVAALRNQYGADMVSLVVENGGGGCGTGYVMNVPGSSFASWAFQVTARSCAVGNLSWAHESGHNLGMEHDPVNGAAPAAASYPWSYGHNVNGVFSTVMSYTNVCPNGCPRIAVFSNPTLAYNGYPVGIDSQRDNAWTAYLTTPIAAGFRAAVAPPTTTAPLAPSGLTVTVGSNTQLNLAWADNATNETGFYVERSADNINYSQIASLGANVTSYANTGLNAATKYYYRVSAYNSAGTSATSNVASATTLSNTPTAPGSLTATAVSSTQVNLTWIDYSTDEVGFYVERSANNGSTYTQIATLGVNAVNYSDTGLTAGAVYYYRVRAYHALGTSAYSNVVNLTMPLAAPAAPTTLKATPSSSSQINITWTDNATNEGGYKLERSTDNVTFTLLATLGANVVSYSNTGLSQGVMYYYRAYAYNSGGNSAYSNTAGSTTLTTAPAAPSALTATAASGTQVNLAWTDNATTETGFKVERSTNGTTFTQINTTGTNVKTYSDTALAAGTYYYRVCAYNTAGNSAYTSNVTVTVTGLPSPWLTADIGTTGKAGSASQASGSYTVNGAGVIGGTADSFRFVYQTLSGDGEIKLRLNSATSTSTSARVGVMIRDSLTTGSMNAFMGVDGAKAYKWMTRTTNGGSATTTNSASGTLPNIWLRLVRAGNVITAYKSADGTTWTSVGSVTVTMAANCYIGIAVASGSTSTTGTLNTAVFNSVTAVP